MLEKNSATHKHIQHSATHKLKFSQPNETFSTSAEAVCLK